jgi:DNA polymerase III subunit gamma/tau
MEKFIVSARKYRPATFDTVVGQASITTTLKNAIRNNHLAQAFLFCGPRGVGKTTCARILAKTINCGAITPSVEACNTCESCVSFNNQQSLNIYELDAASNNSVDDIRGLVEQVRFAPHTGQYKIYIIDEVHMLSASAFNAFLKTLEEPPSYAIFILATTEKHKILPTILSRCQIFDFNRIQIEDIAAHLASIARKENITADPDALHIIAQKADGALRDSLSMFDQIVSYAGNTVTYKAVIENLNILDYDYYFRVTDYLLAGDISQSLLLFNEVLNNGFDGHNFINGLSSHLRDLLVCRDEATLKLLEVSPAIKEKYRQQSRNCSPAFLLGALDITNKCDVQYKAAKNQRLLVEITLMKLCGSGSGALQPSLSEDGLKKKPDNAAPAAAAVIAPPAAPALVSHSAAPSSPAPVPPAQPSPRPDAPARPFSSPVKSVSISDLLNEPQKSKAGEPTVSEPPAIAPSSKAFTEEALLAAWTRYAEQMLAAGKKNLHSTLMKRRPELQGTTVLLRIDNKVQEDELALEKTDLLGYIRQQLENSGIQLQVVLIQEQKTPDIAYTDADKFKKMAEKNPNLNELRKNLGLDFDY